MIGGCLSGCVDEFLLPEDKEPAAPGPREHENCQPARQPVKMIAGGSNAAVSGMKQVACLRFAPTDVVGAMLIDPILRKDDRGHFARAWCIREFAEHGIDFVPVEANIGFNVQKGTLRGLETTPPVLSEYRILHKVRTA